MRLMWRNISFRSLIKLRNWGSLIFLIFPVRGLKTSKTVHANFDRRTSQHFPRMVTSAQANAETK